MAEEFSGTEQRHIPHTPVSDIGFQRFGKPTADRMLPVVCNIVKSQIVKINPNRTAFILVNNSDSTVYVGVDSDVTTTYGIPIYANGGTLKRDIETDGQAVTNGLYGVSASDARPMTLFETYVAED